MVTGLPYFSGVKADKIQVLLVRTTTPPAPVPSASAPDMASALPPQPETSTQPMNNATAVIPAPPAGLSIGVIVGIVAAGVFVIGEPLSSCLEVPGGGTHLLTYRCDKIVCPLQAISWVHVSFKICNGNDTCDVQGRVFHACSPARNLLEGAFTS